MFWDTDMADVTSWKTRYKREQQIDFPEMKGGNLREKRKLISALYIRRSLIPQNHCCFVGHRGLGNALVHRAHSQIKMAAFVLFLCADICFAGRHTLAVNYHCYNKKRRANDKDAVNMTS